MESELRPEQPPQPIELRVQYKRLNSFFADYVRNIHRGRTFIATDRLLAMGTDFRFKLEVPGLSEPLVLQGKVQWLVTPEQRPDGAGMGIGFVFDSRIDRERLESIVEALMTESLGRVLFEKLVGDPTIAASVRTSSGAP